MPLPLKMVFLLRAVLGCSIFARGYHILEDFLKSIRTWGRELEYQYPLLTKSLQRLDMIRILLADDHKLLIDGLCPLLESRGNIKVIGVARDGLSAVRMAGEYHPDIILLDISMPLLNGIDAARKILDETPDIKIIMLSMHADRKFIQESLRVGACG